jgi:hypothetical protein
MIRRKFTESDDAQLLRLNNALLTIDAIARAMGRTEGSIHRRLYRLGTAIKNKRPPVRKTHQARGTYENRNTRRGLYTKENCDFWLHDAEARAKRERMNEAYTRALEAEIEANGGRAWASYIVPERRWRQA